MLSQQESTKNIKRKIKKKKNLKISIFINDIVDQSLMIKISILFKEEFIYQ